MFCDGYGLSIFSICVVAGFAAAVSACQPSYGVWRLRTWLTAASKVPQAWLLRASGRKEAALTCAAGQPPITTAGDKSKATDRSSTLPDAESHDNTGKRPCENAAANGPSASSAMPVGTTS